VSRPPALSDLSEPREVLFVTSVLDLGGPQFAAEAAMRAGYAKTEAEADRAAAFLLAAPRIAKAITGEVKRRFDIATASAINTLLEICVNPKAPANARISAAQEILNRSSVGPIMSRSATANINVGSGFDVVLAARKKLSEQELIDITPTIVEHPD
jgi:hypothetical protein